MFSFYLFYLFIFSLFSLLSSLFSPRFSFSSSPLFDIELVEVLLSKVLLCDSNTKKKESAAKNQDSRTNSPSSEIAENKNSKPQDVGDKRDRNSNNKNNNNNSNNNSSDSSRDLDNHGNGDNKIKNNGSKKEIKTENKISEMSLDPRDFDPNSTLHVVRQSMQDQPPKLIFSVCQALGSVGYVFLAEYVRGHNRRAWGRSALGGDANEGRCFLCVRQITVILIAMLRHGVVKVRFYTSICLSVCLPVCLSVCLFYFYC